ncbi:MAG: hypothetical protein AAGB46_07405 [Verrucomicrobiota bacterium]
MYIGIFVDGSFVVGSKGRRGFLIVASFLRRARFNGKQFGLGERFGGVREWFAYGRVNNVTFFVSRLYPWEEPRFLYYED